MLRRQQIIQDGTEYLEHLNKSGSVWPPYVLSSVESDQEDVVESQASDYKQKEKWTISKLKLI